MEDILNISVEKIDEHVNSLPYKRVKELLVKQDGFPFVSARETNIHISDLPFIKHEKEKFSTFKLSEEISLVKLESFDSSIFLCDGNVVIAVLDDTSIFSLHDAQKLEDLGYFLPIEDVLRNQLKEKLYRILS